MNKKDKKILDDINKYRMANLPGLHNERYKCILTINVTSESGIEMLREVIFDHYKGSCTIKTTRDIDEAFRFDHNIGKMIYQWLPVIGKVHAVNVYPVLK